MSMLGLPVATLLRAGLLVALAFLAATVIFLDRQRGGRGEGLDRTRVGGPDGVLARARQRLLMGVPWGSLVSMLFVLLVYGVLQDGFARWYDPLTIPFYSWSYLAPVGVLLAPFSHMSAGHLTGNLLGALFLAPVAEYAWSHFPVRRGETAFASWRTNPYVRAFVLFPAGVFGVGVLTSVLHWGPMIGFSGVVYAFAGFAIVRFPVGTLLAVLVQRLADVAYDAYRYPVAEAEASSQFVTPWFVDIAVQGHLVGFVLGALLGVVVVVHRRDGGAGTRELSARMPSALRVAGATAIFGSLLSPLWALWYIRGADSYVLHRAAGVVLLLTLGGIVALAARTTDRPFAVGISRRTVGLLALLFPLLVMTVVAVPVNLVAVDGPPPGENAVSVREYTVTYAEGVTRPKTQLFDVSVLGESTRVETGGIIVTSDEREVWYRAVSPGRLAHHGSARILVGGLGWRESVSARRAGWSLLQGGSTYQVWLRPPDGEYRHAFSSGPASAGVTLAGRNVSMRPANGSFALAVTRGNQTLGTAGVPDAGANVTVGGIHFDRTGGTITAAVNGTRIPLAKRQRGN